MPFKVANSSIENFDFACLRRRFHGTVNPYIWTVALRKTTSDVDEDEAYWGTPEDWQVLSADALSDDEFDELSEYLRTSGQASA